jgi:pyochelin synthetase
MIENATVSELISSLERAGIHFWEDSGQLRYQGPKGVLTQAQLTSLRAQKEDVLAWLREKNTARLLTADDNARFDPFPLSDVQAAYLLGRNEAFGFGGVACHVYLEIQYPNVEPALVESAWNRLILRHDMLRAVIDPDASQRVLPEVPHFRVEVHDLRGMPREQVNSELESKRAEMSHRKYETTRWPLFDLEVARLDEQDILLFSMDFLVADWASIWLLIGELEALHANPEHALPALSIRFRDYLLAERRLPETPSYLRDREYWWNRLDTFPLAPQLPLMDPGATSGPVRFRRRFMRLDSSHWELLKQRSGQRRLTPSTVVLAAYAAAIERWSQAPQFSLNLTVLNRLPLHAEVNQLVGDFTTVNLLAVNWAEGRSFAQRAAAIGEQLFADLDHRLCSGVEVVRELARRRGRDAALMPIVFTSAIGLGAATNSMRVTGRLDGFGITQTPQVFIDCQAMDGINGLQVNWDMREGIFPEGVADDMFDAFENLLRSLATSDELWEVDQVVPLPAWQTEERARVNATGAPMPEGLLHHAVLAQAARTPERTAVISSRITLSYGELAGRAAAVAAALCNAGCRPGERVAIVMDKGAEQVVAVLGTLLAGAIYLPIDTLQPPLRRAAILANAGVRYILTQSWVAEGVEWPQELQVVFVDRLQVIAPPEPRVDGAPDRPAYVIYTSGSTGMPKGVVISHQAAANTIADINRRFHIGESDRILGLANLGFDLSVYDIFGTLSVGGALVYPDADRRADPSHWAELIARHGVTLWNSVPALMQMLSSYLDGEPAVALPSLRLALLSGDWVPVALPELIRKRIPDIEVIALGGATEASIWSIFHPCDIREEGWKTVPYGTPLANQSFRVLNQSLRDCPVWTRGELYIGGAGLADGYLGDERMTLDRFITHPSDGQRLYRTGDVGRYRPGGRIEFLGREDNQVKIRGHRIELGEIESILCEHSAVAAAAVIVDVTNAGEGSLLGVVETAHAPEPTIHAAAMERLESIARTAANREVRGLSRSQVEAYVDRLDNAELLSMMYSLHRLGLFTTGTGMTADQTVQRGEIDQRYRWLLMRWLDVLAGAGFLEHDPQSRSFAVLRQVEEEDVKRAWQATEQTWTIDLGSPEFLRYLRRNSDSLVDLLRGKTNPVNLLFPEGSFETTDALYRDNALARYLNRAVSAVVHRVAAQMHASGPLRVLEVGAGTGGTTQGVLEVLEAFPFEYLFTDISPFFMPDARNRFGKYQSVRYGIFDIDREYREQGLAPNSFDVILAAGVLENARSIETALSRLVELLTPGGWLIFTEPTHEHSWILASQAFMMTPPEDDRMNGRSYLNRDQWLNLLERAGGRRVLSLPEDTHPLAPHRVQLFAAQMKTDRVPVTSQELSQFLSQRLPEHMIPSHLQVVDALPLTGNGKIDRRVLQQWRPMPSDAGRSITIDEAMDELEGKLANFWAQALAIPQLGRSADFFDHGADSLIMARMAGRLREEIPQAAEIFFDTLLRHMLNEPTVAALARLLRKGQERNTADSIAGRTGRSSNAQFIRFSTEGNGPLRVMFHAGLGTMECFRPLAKELVAQNLGPVTGIVIADTEVYCSLETSEVIRSLADDYAERLLAEGNGRFQLIGYCLGGMYAIEVARRMAERGVEVEDLVLTSSHPVLFDIQDDLMIETLFVPNVGLTVDQLGFGSIDADSMLRAFMHIIEQNNGRVPAGSLVQAGGDPDSDRIGDFYRWLDSRSRADRFADYARIASELTGSEMRPEMVSGLFRVYRQSFRSAYFSPDPYAGDIRFLRPRLGSGFAPGMDDMTLAFWRKVCLGDLSVTDVDGNHYTCMMDPHVQQVAEHISRSLKTQPR